MQYMEQYVIVNDGLLKKVTAEVNLRIYSTTNIYQVSTHVFQLVCSFFSCELFTLCIILAYTKRHSTFPAISSPEIQNYK